MKAEKFKVRFNEMANMYPRLTGRAWESVKEDVRENGVMDAVTLWDDQVRLKQAEAAVKQEAVRKGLSVAEVQQLLSPVPNWLAAARKSRTDAEAVQKIAQELAGHGAGGPELEQHLALVQSADTATKQAIAESFIGMCDEGTRNPDKEQLLGVVRGLCGAARPDRNAEQNMRAVRIEPSASAVRPPE